MNELKMQLSNTVQAVIEGEYSALKAFIHIKDLIKHAEKCLSEIESGAIVESESYEKNPVIEGYKVERTSAAGRWDFSNISAWNKTKESLKEIEENAKGAYKQHQKGIFSVASDGEVLELPAYTPGKDIIKLTAVRK